MPFQTQSTEGWQEFVTKHGKDYVLAGNRFYWPNGAVSDRTATFFQDPPCDPTELLKARRRYFEAELEREVNEFNEYQAECQSMAHWNKQNPSCCPPPEDAADQLKRGKKRINALRKQLSEIDQELGKSPEGVAKRECEQRERERSQKLNEQLRGITSVQI